MKHQFRIIGIFFFLLAGRISFGQSNQEIALEKGRTAIQLMDDGNIDDAIRLLEEAQKLDPDRFDFPYEIAYAHYIQKDYEGAIKILEKIENHKNVSDRLYQLLGNAYDNIGKTDKAVKVYETGLKKFPDSGFLHLESGIICMHKKEYDKALSFFEKGIYVAPAFSSNYFWATKIYCNSTEEMWGMIYGEIFMNLERNTKRTAEISKLLYDTYKSQIAFTSDTSVSVSFSKQMIVNADNLSGSKDLKLPYGLIYEPIFLLSIVNEKNIDINSLDRIRTNFVTNYFEQEFSKKYPNALFEFQRQVMTLGHLEAYNHWILMKGDENAFGEWLSSNKDKWDNFIAWFTDNAIRIDKTNRFYSGQY
jgi:tetratricopeptide (TPR) repeat protein